MCGYCAVNIKIIFDKNVSFTFQYESVRHKKAKNVILIFATSGHRLKFRYFKFLSESFTYFEVYDNESLESVRMPSIKHEDSNDFFDICFFKISVTSSSDIHDLYYLLINLFKVRWRTFVPYSKDGNGFLEGLIFLRHNHRHCIFMNMKN